MRRSTATAKVILVVDDDGDVRETAVNLVKSRGYRMAWATNATDAFRLVQNDRIDAVLTDDRMPGMNGFELAPRIRALDRDMPIIESLGDTSDALKDSAGRLANEQGGAISR